MSDTTITAAQIKSATISDAKILASAPEFVSRRAKFALSKAFFRRALNIPDHVDITRITLRDDPDCVYVHVVDFDLPPENPESEAQIISQDFYELPVSDPRRRGQLAQLQQYSQWGPA